MGCSQTLIEYKNIYDSGELKTHGYKLNYKWYGTLKHYYENGAIKCLCNCNNGMVSGHFLQWYDNGVIDKDLYMYNGFFRKYKKYYDRHGSLIQHIVYNDPKNGMIHSDELRAEYINNKLCSFQLRDKKTIYCPSRIIYNTLLEHDFIIDLSIINPIRTIQRIFKRRMYNFILSTLNNVIDINDISKLIMSYLTKKLN